MKYFCYLRKSSEDDEKQAESKRSQQHEIDRMLPSWPDVEIVDVLEESMSAKAPGRPVFDDMISRIEAGEAQGIIAWHPDRLARNSVDGGRIIYLVDQGILEDLRFVSYTFEDTPQGKFMLSLAFGQSKLYVDDLSVNVRRGIRNRVENGWHPSIPPIGYLNKKDDQTIIADPERYDTVRKIFQHVLAGQSPRDVWLLARDKWQLTTARRKRIGGRPVTLSCIYKLLTNPFYAGVIVWQGKHYSGKHPAMITVDQFEELQARLGRPGRPRRKRHRFPFTGLMICGECGYSVTAEHKVNRHGSRYTYYHCSKRSPTTRCRQRSVQAEELESQILDFLQSIRLKKPIHDWAQERLKRLHEHQHDAEDQIRAELAQAVGDADRQLSNLTRLRVKDLVTDEEYLEQRKALEADKTRAERRLEEGPHEWFEPARVALKLRYRAPEWFAAGNDDTKRFILEMTGSNPVLVDKKLSIRAAKPFEPWPDLPSDSDLRGAGEEVRTLSAKKRKKLEELVLAGDVHSTALVPYTIEL